MLLDSAFVKVMPAVVIAGAVGKWATAVTLAVVHLSTALRLLRGPDSRSAKARET